MSQSSCFIILRQDLKNKQYIDDIKYAYKYSGYKIEGPENDFDKKIKEEDIPEYVACGRLKHVNKVTKEIFTNIFEMQFNSCFQTLIEQYNLCQYGARNTIVISLTMAEKILQAINYLLSQKYDIDFQWNVLQNDYIQIFGQLYTPYFNFYNKSNEPENMFAYDQQYRTQKIIMKRIKIILSTYVEMVADQTWNNLKHVLIYTVY